MSDGCAVAWRRAARGPARRRQHKVPMEAFVRTSEHLAKLLNLRELAAQPGADPRLGMYVNLLDEILAAR